MSDSERMEGNDGDTEEESQCKAKAVLGIMLLGESAISPDRLFLSYLVTVHSQNYLIEVKLKTIFEISENFPSNHVLKILYLDYKEWEMT